MRFLFISSYFPQDLKTCKHGVYQRMLMFISALEEIGTLDCLFFVDPDLEISNAYVRTKEKEFKEEWGINISLILVNKRQGRKTSTRWQSYGVPAISIYNRAGYYEICGVEQINTLMKCLKKKYDAVFAHRLEVMCLLLLLKKKILPPIFFDLDDIEHVKFFKDIRQPPKWKGKYLYYLQIPALLWGERKAIALAKKAFVCSENDRKYLKMFLNLSNTVSIANAVNIPKSTLPITNDKNILFLGSYNYKPNIQSAEFLVDKIFPLVRKKIPDVNLIIAGKDPHRLSFCKKDLKGVKIIGFVDDLDKLYSSIKIVCCPIFSGGGTRIKIIEAAAYGKPVVATKIAAEGLNLEDDKEIFIHDDKDSFANRCIDLLQNNNVCENIGIAARKKIIRNYERGKIIKLVQDQVINVT